MTDDGERSREDLAARYARPYGWWGPERGDVEPRSLPWLINAGSLGPREAAFLSLAIQYRRSLIIAAEPATAGKTTLLTALLDFMDPDVTPIYVRGIYERFEFVTLLSPEESYVLCNEISAHLPAYMWGRGARYLFDALDAGFPLATTMHASSPLDALEQLQRFPLEVPPEQVALLDLIVMLDLGYVENELVRRVTNIAAVGSRERALTTRTIAERNPLRAAITSQTGRMIATLAAWTGTSDREATQILIIRERLINSWLDARVFERADVRRQFLAHLGRDGGDDATG